MRGTTQKVVTATLAFVLVTPSVWTYAQTGSDTSPVPSPKIQPAQAVSPAEPAANWPEVTERLNQPADTPSGFPNPVETPTYPSDNLIPFAAEDQPAADALLVIPSDATRAANQRTSLSLPLNGSTQQANVEYLAQAPVNSAQGSALSSVDMLFRLEFDAGAKQRLTQLTQPLRLAVDYSAVLMEHGGDYEERLTLFIGTGCAFNAAGEVTDCAEMTPLRRTNYANRKQLIAEFDTEAMALLTGETTALSTVTSTVDLALLGHKTFLPIVTQDDASKPITADGSAIVVLSAGVDGPTGDYGATPVGDVLDYQVGLYTGAAQTSYAIPVPPAAAGPAPDVALTYDSGTIDGSGIARSAQPGIAGIGWTQKAGAIIRLLKKSPTSGSDQHCWTNTPGGDFLLSLNGTSSRLVRVSGGDYVLQDDPRWKIQFLTTTEPAHPDYEKTYWLVTTPDGTKYRFGGEIEPETGTDQNSVFWLPMHKEATATSCTGAVQNRTWQWSLDRVEDTNGNVVSYFYAPELQYYNSNGTIRQYTRGGTLRRIEYSKRAGTSVQPHARVLFHTEMRCQDPTTVAGCDTTADFPDTPTDFQCGSSTSCTKHGATFWTYRRLHAIQTQVYDNVNSRWTTAGVWELNHTFPVPPVDPNGYSGVPKLWLNSIARWPGGDYNWSPYNQIEAEDFDGMNGVATATTDDVGAGGHIDTLQAGDWIRFDRMNFSEGANLFLARVWSSAAMNVEVRLDASTATPIATIAVPNQSSTWKTVSAALSGVIGIHDVYLSFSGASVNKLKVNWIRFNRAAIPIVDISPVHYNYVMLAGRSNPSTSLNYQIMPRVMTITNELGGVAEFTYGQSHTTWNATNCQNLGNTTARPELDCFRAYYASDTQGAGTMTWWKYKVLQLREWDTFSGNPVRTTSYGYGRPIFAFYDDPTNSYDYWNEFRGHEVVTTTDASGVKVEHRFYRGMNGDKLNSSGGTYSGVVTQSDGTTRVDYAWLRGKEFETRVIGSTSNVLQRALNDYVYTLTAGRGITGSYFTAPQFITDTIYGTVNKTTQTDTAYDSYGNVTQHIQRGDIAIGTDDRNTVRTYVYNTAAYIVDGVSAQTLCAGATACAAGSELSRTEYEYDNAGIGAAPVKGNLTRVRAFAQTAGTPVFFDTVRAYDTYGRVSSVTDPKNNTTTTSYHPFYGYVQSVTNALNHVVTTVNDPKWGVPLTVTDPNGNITTLQYDGYGRRTAVWLPTEPTSGPASAQTIYAATARPAYVQTHALMTRATSTYVDAWAYVDGFGRALQTQRADVTASRVVASKAYNALGQLQFASAPYAASGTAGSGYVQPAWTSLANYHAYTYDERGNLKQDTTFSGSTALWNTQTILDGWSKSAYDPNGNRTDYLSDAFGRLTQVTEYAPATQSTFYSYNGRDDLTQVTDAASNITTIAYDLLSRKTGMTDPDMGTWNYGYDDNGNLTSQQDARGWWLYLEYDGLNRLVRKRRDATNGTVLAEWNYDAIGQKGLLASSAAYTAIGTVQVSNVSYDARNRLTQQQWSIPTQGTFRFDYGYNEANQQTSLRYPGGNAGQQGELVTKGYYAQTGQFNTATSDDGTPFVAYTSYNPLGQVIEQRNDAGTNGLTRRVAYDSATLRTNRIYAGSGGQSANLQDLNFTFDNNGNIKSLTDALNSGQKQCFGYDALNRLTSAFTGDANCSSFVNSGVGAYNHSYSYNAIGNITSNAGNAYTYGSSKPHAVTAAFGNSYGYDANGNMTSRTIAGVTYDLTFDYDNRITDVKQDATTLGSFVYDADGNRVLGTVSGVTTAYVNGLYEYQNGATTKYYDGGAMRRTGYAANNGISYVLGDQLGSSSKIVGQNGALQASNYFFPFGGNRGGSAFSDLTTKRFTGQYHESALPGGEGLSYYNARWYDAQLGRFVAPDTLVPAPADPQNLNRFSYVNNNPILYRDPSGHWVDKGTGDNGDWRNDSPHLVYKPDHSRLRYWNSRPVGGSRAFFDYGGRGFKWKQIPEVARNLIRSSGSTETTFNAEWHEGNVEDHSEEFAFQVASLASGARVLLKGIQVISQLLRIGLATACLDGNCTNEAESVWSMGWAARGRAFEQMVSQNTLHPNFPVIDDLIDGTAISYKTIDLGAKSYQTTKALEVTLTRYANALSKFEGATYGASDVGSADIVYRQLVVGIPASATPDQLQTMGRIALWAKSLSNPVSVSYVVVK